MKRFLKNAGIAAGIIVGISIPCGLEIATLNAFANESSWKFPIAALFAASVVIAMGAFFTVCEWYVNSSEQDGSDGK